MAAEFHQDRRHVLRRERRQVPAYGRGTGKRDQSDLVLLDQVLGDFGRRAEHKVEHAGWQARIVQCARDV